MGFCCSKNSKVNSIDGFSDNNSSLKEVNLPEEANDEEKPSNIPSLNEEIENIRVAVRVRNLMFNLPRELQNGSQLIVKMTDKRTGLLKYKDNYERWFDYDHCYWSVNGYIIEENGYYAPITDDGRYADQKRIFADIGAPVLINAFRGYNVTLFAYGQTGSGKTYTMFGDSANRGLIPTIFAKICPEAEINVENKIKAEFSMVEIYNEKLRDLMNSTDLNLLIREGLKEGFFIPGLLEFTMNQNNYKDLLNKGLKNRQVAETNMNDKSSRSHIIITIKITQNEGEFTKVSQVNLVDLAGSEWNGKSLATGLRFDEAKSINRSLFQLSLCLYKLSEGLSFVPYRDSPLTKLLKNSLQNNGKTFMIATISPSDKNYEETLSTLIYAERAKGIKVKARINYEDPKDVQIAELERENKRLKMELELIYQAVPRELIEKYVSQNQNS